MSCDACSCHAKHVAAAAAASYGTAKLRSIPDVPEPSSLRITVVCTEDGHSAGLALVHGMSMTIIYVI